MLTRERVALRVLEEAGGQLSKTVFVKLMFLLRVETELEKLPSFYDFVPYKYGPFSFGLYRDIGRLESYGFISESNDQIVLQADRMNETRQSKRNLDTKTQFAIHSVVERYGHQNLSALIETVYVKYPWYAIHSERPERDFVSLPDKKKAPPAVYTAGYEGKSVDGFFNHLLQSGIESVIDVRANPVSRKYGFAGSRMKQIGESLRLNYHHVPSLGISSSERATLSDEASRTRLFAQYEQTTLVDQNSEVLRVGEYMKRKPSVLVCVEKDVECCHRSRLANAIANETAMEVIHL